MLLVAELRAYPLERDAVRVFGPDARAFLQGQLSQDIDPLEVGASVESLVLQPQGKVDGYVRVTRLDDDELVLDTDAGHGPALIARLSRFKLRTKAEIEPVDWHFVALRGDGDAAFDLADDVHALPVWWPGVPGVDLAGPSAVAPSTLPAGTAAELEALRIQAGVPTLGRELTDKTIPAEAGIVERTVSFTKGCFTGQELVARIDSRGGNVPRLLRGIVVGGEAVPSPGAAVMVDGREAGTLTSAAWSDALGGPIGLAYIRRDVAPPADATVDGVAAAIRALPLVP